MAYQAIGRGVKRTEKGLEVKVEIMNDQTGKTLRFETYEGKSLVAVQALVKADLDQLVTNEQDAVLSAAVVGVLLATSQAVSDVPVLAPLVGDVPAVDPLPVRLPPVAETGGPA